MQGTTETRRARSIGMMLLYEELSEKIRGAAIEVHRELGPGLLESTYEECLGYEWNRRGISFQRKI